MSEFKWNFSISFNMNWWRGLRHAKFWLPTSVFLIYALIKNSGYDFIIGNCQIGHVLKNWPKFCKPTIITFQRILWNTSLLCKRLHNLYCHILADTTGYYLSGTIESRNNLQVSKAPIYSTLPKNKMFGQKRLFAKFN